MISKSDFYVVKAYNDLGALPGDKVLVEINDHIALGVAFLIYIFPILLTPLFIFFFAILPLTHFIPLFRSGCQYNLFLFILKKEIKNSSLIIE